MEDVQEQTIRQELIGQYEKISSLEDTIQFAFDFTQRYLRQVDVSKQALGLMRTVNSDDPGSVKSVRLLNEVIIPQLPALMVNILGKNPNILLANSLSAYVGSEVFTIISKMEESCVIFGDPSDRRGIYNKYAQFAFSPIDKIRGKVKDILVDPEFEDKATNILEIANIVSGGIFKNPTDCEGSATHRKFATLFWTCLFYAAHTKRVINLRRLDLSYEDKKGCWPLSLR